MSIFDQLFGRNKTPDVSNFPRVGYTQGGKLFGTDGKPVVEGIQDRMFGGGQEENGVIVLRD